LHLVGFFCMNCTAMHGSANINLINYSTVCFIELQFTLTRLTHAISHANIEFQFKIGKAGHLRKLPLAVIMNATSLIQSTNHNVEWYYINTNTCLLIYKFLPGNFLISHLIISKGTKNCHSANQTNNYPHLSVSFSTISETFAARSTGPKFNINTDLQISLLCTVTKHNIAQTRQNNYLLQIFTLVATTENSPH